MITLTEARAYAGTGRLVLYTSDGGETVEEGVITSVGKDLVFVRYRGDHGSKSTHPRNLQWVSP